MDTTLFSDRIISATELKNNQKKWFDTAVKTPVSITNRGSRHFVLINREQIGNLVLVREYSEKIVRYCRELQEAKKNFKSEVFPWAQYLDEKDRQEFRDELIAAFTDLLRSNDWSAMDDIISSWEATAEALRNPEFMGVVDTPASDRKYVEID